MPKQIPKDELESMLAIVAAHPEGVRAGAIHEELESKLPPRMLQRRLALLVEQNRLIAEGRGRGRWYRFPGIVSEVRVTDKDDKALALGEVYPPISPDGAAIKQMVRESFQNRCPVGYNRAFLDAYRPNETFYLPAQTRQHLLAIGHSPDGQRPAGTYARHIYSRLLIDLSWNSSRLEGNTYSLLETERLLELGESAEGKDALEAQMILNHKAAIELLVEQADEVGFNRYTLLNLHALLSENLLADPTACGRLRTIVVEIHGTVFHPLAVPQLVEEAFQQVLDTAAAIHDPFEQAFFVMVHLPYLQPFEDVNKRVSRLAANIPLIRGNLSPLSFVDVTERAYVDGILGVYELNRVELLHDVFVWAYERSCARYSAVRKSLGQPDPFRLRYRDLLAEVVADVVRSRKDKKNAAAYIQQMARQRVNQEDVMRFVEIAETELMSLHEGNIARYRLRPSEYTAWRETWK
jgi:Fic family protein